MDQRPGGQAGADGVRGKYACPKCGAHVVMVTYYSGWDKELLDCKTGESIRTLRSERVSVHDVDYFCNKDCGWRESFSWKDDLDEELDEVQNEQET